VKDFNKLFYAKITPLETLFVKYYTLTLIPSFLNEWEIILKKLKLLKNNYSLTTITLHLRKLIQLEKSLVTNKTP